MQPVRAGARIADMLIAEQSCRRIERGWTPGAALYGPGALVLLVLWLHLLGRPLLCPCGTVRLWAPAHDSQHLADWYSLLHLSFGAGLAVLIALFQPRWPAARKLLAALLGSVAWEAIENLPAVIAMFNPPGSGASYRGDTILNALGDTAFVLAGSLVAARLSWRGILLAVILIEAVVWFAIKDGLLVGSFALAFA